MVAGSNPAGGVEGNHYAPAYGQTPSNPVLMRKIVHRGPAVSESAAPLLARYVAVHACPKDGMVRVGVRTPPKYGSRPTAEMPCTCEDGSHAVVVMVRGDRTGAVRIRRATGRRAAQTAYRQAHGVASTSSRDGAARRARRWGAGGGRMSRSARPAAEPPYGQWDHHASTSAGGPVEVSPAVAGGTGGPWVYHCFS